MAFATLLLETGANLLLQDASGDLILEPPQEVPTRRPAHAFSPFAAPGYDRLSVTARVSCARVKVKARAPRVETSDYSPEWIAFDEQEAAGALLLM